MSEEARMYKALQSAQAGHFMTHIFGCSVKDKLTLGKHRMTPAITADQAALLT